MVNKSSEGVFIEVLFCFGWKAGLDHFPQPFLSLGLALCLVCWPKFYKEGKGRGRGLTFIELFSP